MKQFVRLAMGCLAVLALTVVFAGCGGTPPPADTTGTAQPAEPAAPPTTEPAAPPTTEPAAPPTTEPAAPPTTEPAAPATTEPAAPAEGDKSADASAASGAAATDSFDDFDYSSGGGTASKRR